jgi:molecular chaperone HtpG
MKLYKYMLYYIYIMETETETYAFSADINQLLSLIINAVYSNKEVFLRELISNASDALNKVKYESLKNPSYLDNENNLEIKISFDKANKILTIRDTGIGMTKDELVNNLGTIASSGTKKFLESLSDNNGSQFIGQFGVGFYSGYLISDKIVVVSKHNDDEQYMWESTGNGTFDIQKDETDYQLKRGSILMLHIKDDMTEYLEDSKITSLIKKHNQFIEFPIYVETQKTREVELENSEQENTVEQKDSEQKDSVEEQKEEPKKVTETYFEYEQVNKEKPLWCRNNKDVTDDEYSEFYKSMTGDYDTYLDVSHFTVEGQIEFKGLLYIPKKSPIDLFDGQTKRKGMIKLYSRKVFITDDCEDIVPEYLKFVKGVIETEDIPLNISRETLQQNKIIKIIAKNIMKKIFEMFNAISEDPDKFRIFYEQYNKSIKLGIHEDATYRNKLVPLLRYETSNSNGDLISLDDYIENMQPNQNSIYYITAESVKSITNSPFLEKLKSKNYEVIYMCDPLDEYITQQVRDYKDKKLVCITKENIDIESSSSEKEEFENSKIEFKNVCDYMKSTLSDEVEKVIVSNKLADSPCILSTSEFGWTANMQRILKAQTFNKPEMNFMMGRKILEINPNNSIIQKIKYRLDNEQMDSELSNLVTLLYDITLQASGFTVEDPSKFSNRVLKLIDNGLISK